MSVVVTTEVGKTYKMCRDMLVDLEHMETHLLIRSCGEDNERSTDKARVIKPAGSQVSQIPAECIAPPISSQQTDFNPTEWLTTAEAADLLPSKKPVRLVRMVR